MAEVINLRLARKARQRAEASKLAEQNRARHGQTKAERQAIRAAAERSERELDGHQREPKED